VPDRWARCSRSCSRGFRTRQGGLSTHCTTTSDGGRQLARRGDERARQVECTINGWRARRQRRARGNRDGRPDALRRPQCRTAIDATQIVPTSKLVSTITGYPVQPTSGGGANAFAHESGIHQDGVLKHARPTRSCGPRTWLGRDRSRWASLRRNAFRSRLAELASPRSEEASTRPSRDSRNWPTRSARSSTRTPGARLRRERHAEHERFKLVSLVAIRKRAKALRARGDRRRRHETSGGARRRARDARSRRSSRCPQRTELLLFSVNKHHHGTDSQGR